MESERLSQNKAVQSVLGSLSQTQKGELYIKTTTCVAYKIHFLYVLIGSRNRSLCADRSVPVIVLEKHF